MRGKKEREREREGEREREREVFGPFVPPPAKKKDKKYFSPVSK